MKQSKVSMVVALLLAAMMLLAGCTTAPAAEQGGSASEPASAGGSAPAEDVTLVYWSMWNETEPQAQVITEATEAFMTDHPGVKIDIQWNGREIRKTLQPALDAGTTIDIWDEDLERVVKNWGSYALNLDEYSTKSFAFTGDKPYDQCVLPSMLQIAKDFAADGSLYAVPYQPMIVAIFYNKALFEQAGIAAAPKTWTEFEDACAKLKAAGITPLTIDDFFMDLPYSSHLARLKGVEWVSQLVTDKTGAMWDDPAVIEAAKAYEGLAANGYFSPNVASNVYPAGQYEVGNGNVAMYLLNGTWLPNELRSVAGEDFRWGAFAYPAVEGGTDDIYCNMYGSQAFQINKNCANPDIAFEYAVYLTTGEWDKKMSEMTIGAPMGTDVEWPSDIADLKVILDGMKANYPWSCGFADDADVLAVMISEFTRLISGQVTADQFVAALKAAGTKS